MNHVITKLKSQGRSTGHFLRILFLVLLGMGLSGMQPARADHITAADVEQFVRARIDLGESMGNFFRGRRSPQFGPEGEGPDMEALRRLEAEINNHVASVLAKHDLSIEEYQDKSPEVFDDKEAVNRFLEANPDLKERYERLPQSPRRGRR